MTCAGAGSANSTGAMLMQLQAASGSFRQLQAAVFQRLQAVSGRTFRQLQAAVFQRLQAVSGRTFRQLQAASGGAFRQLQAAQALTAKPPLEPSTLHAKIIALRVPKRKPAIILQIEAPDHPPDRPTRAHMHQRSPPPSRLLSLATAGDSFSGGTPTVPGFGFGASAASSAAIRFAAAAVAKGSGGGDDNVSGPPDAMTMSANLDGEIAM
eukprot:363264-Chlamydomonas_euryale.AAC.11